MKLSHCVYKTTRINSDSKIVVFLLIIKELMQIVTIFQNRMIEKYFILK